MVGQDVTDDTEAVATMCGPHDALLNAEHVESALLDPLHTDERVASPANPGGLSTRPCSATAAAPAASRRCHEVSWIAVMRSASASSARRRADGLWVDQS